eukprot:363937-Chlamydomonas_euryale.AAC.7
MSGGQCRLQADCMSGGQCRLQADCMSGGQCRLQADCMSGGQCRLQADCVPGGQHAGAPHILTLILNPCAHAASESRQKGWESAGRADGWGGGLPVGVEVHHIADHSKQHTARELVSGLCDVGHTRVRAGCELPQQAAHQRVGERELVCRLYVTGQAQTM